MLEERVTVMWWYPSRPKSSDHGRLIILVMTLSRTMGQRINGSEEADWMLTIISDYLTLALVQDEISGIGIREGHFLIFPQSPIPPFFCKPCRPNLPCLPPLC